MTRRRNLVAFAEGLVIVALILTAWQVWAMTAQPPPVYYPTPSRIATSAWVSWLSVGGLTRDVFPSLERVLAGWVLAAVVGVTLGVAIGLFRRIGHFIDPVIQFMRAVPPPVILPVFLILLGIGDGMKVAFIAFGVVWPILLNTVKGVRSVEPMQLETAAAFRLTGMRRLGILILPAASPDIFAGLRISLSLALVLMVISEMIAAGSGIGFRILNSQATFNIAGMWAAIGVLALSGVVFNALFSILESRVLRWHGTARAHE
jgi:ABC-type nitrate/sulfonate/bicarbonate transport system permease component